ncbi:hypothetical protein WMY93_031541 [Mugilogobius chulae]|uniref:Immunoglobulin domain-containing protein n=1 Tax=Mugilogobius chulae TaxID=88201 RepID=A0AAW0MM07_9GOBI
MSLVQVSVLGLVLGLVQAQTLVLQVHVGQTVVLKCSVEEHKTFWFMETQTGLQICISRNVGARVKHFYVWTHFQKFSLEGNSLRIHNITESDLRKYSCAQIKDISRTFGFEETFEVKEIYKLSSATVTHRSDMSLVQVSVLGLVLGLVQAQTKVLEIQLNETVVLNCSVAEDQTVWFLEASPGLQSQISVNMGKSRTVFYTFTDFKKFSIKGSSLIISDITEQDLRIYTCAKFKRRAQSGFNESFSVQQSYRLRLSVQVSVLGLVLGLVQAQTLVLQVHVGQTVVLNCSVEEHKTFWFMEIQTGLRMKIARSDYAGKTEFYFESDFVKFSLDKNSLMIHNISKSDLRIYSCARRNRTRKTDSFDFKEKYELQTDCEQLSLKLVLVHLGLSLHISPPSADLTQSPASVSSFSLQLQSPASVSSFSLQLQSVLKPQDDFYILLFRFHLRLWMIRSVNCEQLSLKLVLVHLGLSLHISPPPLSLRFTFLQKPQDDFYILLFLFDDPFKRRAQFGFNEKFSVQQSYRLRLSASTTTPDESPDPEPTPEPEPEPAAVDLIFVLNCVKLSGVILLILTSLGRSHSSLYSSLYSHVFTLIGCVLTVGGAIFLFYVRRKRSDDPQCSAKVQVKV